MRQRGKKTEKDRGIEKEMSRERVAAGEREVQSERAAATERKPSGKREKLRKNKQEKTRERKKNYPIRHFTSWSIHRTSCGHVKGHVQLSLKTQSRKPKTY